MGRPKEKMSAARIIEGVIIAAAGSLIVAFVVSASVMVWSKAEDLSEKVYADYKGNFQKLEEAQSQTRQALQAQLEVVRQIEELEGSRSKIVEGLKKVCLRLEGEIRTLRLEVAERDKLLAKLAREHKGKKIDKQVAMVAGAAGKPKPKADTQSQWQGIQLEQKRAEHRWRLLRGNIQKQTKLQEQQQVQKLSY